MLNDGELSNVTGHELWLQVCTAAGLGALAGGWAVGVFTGRRLRAQMRRTTDALVQRYAANEEQLRNSHLRAQTDLELARKEFRRHADHVTQENRAAQARLEEELIAAYEEINRLRQMGVAVVGATTELTDGFAATQPMVDGL